MSRAQQRNDPPFPIVGGQTHPFVDYQPYLGGIVRIVNGITANVAIAIQHNLRRVPLGMFVINASGVFTPKWQKTAAWDTAQIHVEFDTTVTNPNTITLWIL